MADGGLKFIILSRRAVYSDKKKVFAIEKFENAAQGSFKKMLRLSISAL